MPGYSKMADEVLLLGVPDEKMGQNDDRICGWSTNKIGGTPNWMYGEPSHYPSCPTCGRKLFLVSQVYCPLSGSPYHRVLYLFGCTSPSCWNVSQSWKVLRCQAKDTSSVYDEESEAKASCQFEADEWCDDAEDWGDEEIMTSDPVMSDLEQHTGKMSVCRNTEQSTSKETVVETGHKSTAFASNTFNTPHFLPYYISVLEDCSNLLPAPNSLKHEKNLLAEYQEREGVKLDELLEPSGSTKSWSGEMYEKPSLKHGDKAFHKFYKTVQSCSQQILRYQRDGHPLSLTTTTPRDLQTRVPPCQNCGSSRVFEMQLMPALVNILRVEDDSTLESIAYTQRNNQEAQMKGGGSVENSPNERTLKCNKKLSNAPEEQHFSESETVIAEDFLGVCDRTELMEAISNSSDVAIEFGTVIVYTCANSCWLDDTERDSLREEYVIVEADPDAKLFLQGLKEG